MDVGLAAQVMGASQVESHTVYDIRIGNASGAEWTVQKRYSAVTTLITELTNEVMNRLMRYEY